MAAATKFWKFQMYFISQSDAEKQTPPVIHLNPPQIREQIRNHFKQEFENQMLR